MKPKIVKQILQYGTVGVFALGIDVGTFLLLRGMDFGIVPSNVLARLAGAIAAYCGNFLWTFSRSPIRAELLRSIWRYALLWVGATLVSTLLLTGLTKVGANERASKLGVEMLMPVLNFVISRHWVFR
ncbi:MAG: GtrA family protein [Betaproteobacteria bacterium]